jgi:hypothetical protein
MLMSSAQRFLVSRAGLATPNSKRTRFPALAVPTGSASSFLKREKQEVRLEVKRA